MSKSIAILSITLLVLSIISIFVGVVSLNPNDILSLDDNQLNVLLSSRLPRTLSIIIAGMSLSLCGLIMQQLTQNKFVAPTTAGTMDFAKLGIIISLMFFPEANLLLKLLFATVLALLGTSVFIQIIQKVKFKDIVFVPLIGIMLGNVISSLGTYIALKSNSIQSIGSWFQGDFSIVTSGRYEILFITIPLLIIAGLYANQFTIAGMGESFSVNLGLNYQRIVQIGLLITSIITAVVVVTVGMLPFLGLIVPNIVSLYRGDSIRNTLVHVSLTGAILVMICDIIGRIIIFPYEIAIGLVIGVVGSVVFLIMILRSRKGFGEA
ncbi:ABC transporter permease [Abyssicoccus albus]|uniref:ABC transporter permease n=1 Tax=Abyssicoccus albus TaxID=1817405 RepID=UPI00097E3D44|nr:iron chelate uptake ABC transporter family permease subunit [Abyssicoccus albus]AQL56723.1 iron ABC transporter permease [Abyssicoccus albus]